MRSIRVLLAALVTGATLWMAAPAGAVMCNEAQDPDCDCSIRVLGKVIVPCNY